MLTRAPHLLAGMMVALLVVGSLPADGSHLRETPYASHWFETEIDPAYTQRNGDLAVGGDNIFRSFPEVNRNGGGTGVVQHYRLDGTFVKEIQNPDSIASYDYFGREIQFLDGHLLIGVPGDEGPLGGDAYAGKIWLYDIAADEFVRAFASPEPGRDSQIGRGFAAEGDTLAARDHTCGCIRVYDIPSGDYRGRIDSDGPQNPIAPFPPELGGFRDGLLFVEQQPHVDDHIMGFFYNPITMERVGTLEHPSLLGHTFSDVTFAGDRIYFSTRDGVAIADASGNVLQVLRNPDAGSFNTTRFGALHDDRLVVAARSFDSEGNRLLGRVYVYEMVDGAWELESRLNHRYSRPHAQFGTDMAVTGNTLVIMTRGSGETVPSWLSTYVLDTDNDGLEDWEERDLHGTDPRNPDTDGDGLNDGDEIRYRSDPFVGDSDGDGLSDGDEVHTYGTLPTRADSDGDTLSDPDELFVHGTDPRDRDTDGDLSNDGREVRDGTDPRNPLSFTTPWFSYTVTDQTRDTELPVTDGMDPFW